MYGVRVYYIGYPIVIGTGRICAIRVEIELQIIQGQKDKCLFLKKKKVHFSAIDGFASTKCCMRTVCVCVCVR